MAFLYSIENQMITQLQQKFKVNDLYFNSITDPYPLSVRRNLQERDVEIAKIKYVWKKRVLGYKPVPVVQDRDFYKLPICVGLPGVGKTALIDRAFEVLREISPESTVISITIPYFNGHSLQPCEKRIENPIANTRSVVWRMLHRWFLERRAGLEMASFGTYMNLMAADDLSYDCDFSLALRVIRRVLVNASFISEETVLSVCLAIDEYQTIPGLLEDILQMLLDSSIDLATNHRIHLYPIMAGTQWTKLDGAGPSTDFCVKIPLAFLSTSACLNIAKEILPGKLYSDTFRDSVVLLGQLPRPLIFYLESVRSHYSVFNAIHYSELTEKRRMVLETYHKTWNLQPLNSILVIVAYSVTGIGVREDDESPVIYKHYLSDRDPQKFEERKVTWNQLAGVGLLQLQPIPGQMMSKVDVPIAAILSLIASREEHFDPNKPYQWLFVQAMSDIIDLNVVETNPEPWQRWEQFGAHFHALRINAFMVLGYSSISLNQLFSGLQCYLSEISNDMHVVLKPAIVYESECQLAPHVNLKKVAEKRNIPFESENLLDSRQSSVYRVCVNGTGGEAVDIFFVLFCFRKSASKPKIFPVLILDQRKCEARSLHKQYVENLINSMKARIPTKFPPTGIVVPLIFSALAMPGAQLQSNAGLNVAIYSRKCLADYFGSLRHLPSVNLLISVRNVNQSTLTSFLGCSVDLAKDCLLFIENSRLLMTNNFMTFLEDQYVRDLSNDRKEELLHVLQNHFIFDDVDVEVPDLSSLLTDRVVIK